MTLDSATLTRASRSLRGYNMAGRQQARDEAHAALSDLILEAQAQGDEEAFNVLNHARDLLGLGPAQANDADNLLDALARSRRT